MNGLLRDLFRFGNDRTTFVLRQGHVVERIAIDAKQDTMVTVGRAVQLASAWRVEEIYVDVIGLGAGVYDRLAELAREKKLPVKVISVKVAEAAPRRQVDDDAQGKTLRDHLWLETMAWLRDDAPVFAADRDHCEDLAGELSSVKYAPDSCGRIVIESKDAMRRRGLRSPDLADGLILTFYTPPEKSIPIVAPICILLRDSWGKGMEWPNRKSWIGGWFEDTEGRRSFGSVVSLDHRPTRVPAPAAKEQTRQATR